MSELLTRIKTFLSSDDIEMVNLGVVIMQDKIDRGEWEQLLEECLEENKEYTITYGSSTEIVKSKVAKYLWKITEYNEVEVKRPEPYVGYTGMPGYSGWYGVSGTSGYSGLSGHSSSWKTPQYPQGIFTTQELPFKKTTKYQKIKRWIKKALKGLNSS